jgi:hypothetical protein
LGSDDGGVIAELRGLDHWMDHRFQSLQNHLG